MGVSGSISSRARCACVCVTWNAAASCEGQRQGMLQYWPDCKRALTSSYTGLGRTMPVYFGNGRWATRLDSTRLVASFHCAFLRPSRAHPRCPCRRSPWCPGRRRWSARPRTCPRCRRLRVHACMCVCFFNTYVFVAPSPNTQHNSCTRRRLTVVVKGRLHRRLGQLPCVKLGVPAAEHEHRVVLVAWCCVKPNA